MFTSNLLEISVKWLFQTRASGLFSLVPTIKCFWSECMFFNISFVNFPASWWMKYNHIWVYYTIHLEHVKFTVICCYSSPYTILLQTTAKNVENILIIYRLDNIRILQCIWRLNVFIRYPPFGKEWFYRKIKIVFLLLSTLPKTGHGSMNAHNNNNSFSVAFWFCYFIVTYNLNETIDFIQLIYVQRNIHRTFLYDIRWPQPFIFNAYFFLIVSGKKNSLSSVWVDVLLPKKKHICCYVGTNNFFSSHSHA